MIIKDTWGHFLRDKLEENKDRIAVIDIGKNVRCTYGDLRRRSESIEKAFLGCGVKRGTHVALVFPSSSKWIATFLALINIGAVPVCLNSEGTVEEIKYKITQSDSKVVVTNEVIYSKIRQIEEEIGLDLVIIENRQCACSLGIHCGWNTFIAKGKEVTNKQREEARAKVKYDDPLAIQYTSGTTGKPKGVVSLHYKVLSNMITFSKVFNYTKEDKVLSSLPMYHVMGCFFSCLLLFSVGGCLVLMGKFSTERSIEAIIEEKCTSFHGVPTMYKLILNKMGDRRFDSLNKGMIGGACCDLDTMDDIIHRMNIKNIMYNYGQSEACGYTQVRIGDPIEKVKTTVGRPIEGIEIKIVDDEGNELPPYTKGEIIVKSEYHMAGYYKDEEATKKTIVDEWIYTGDLGELDEEGFLKISGRKKDIIIRGGENISPIELEDVLRQYDLIQDIAVVGIPDQLMGQEIGAFVIPKNEAKTLDKDLLINKVKEYAEKHLAKYEQPRYIKIIDGFPLTGSGKVQRFKLVSMV